MTAPASSTPRPTTTNKPAPQSRSGTAAVNWFATKGIRVERVLSDNGACYRSRYWINYNTAAGIKVKKTRPYRPQTNGKIERFHRILVEEWAYIRPWTSETQRRRAYDGFIHFYKPPYLSRRP